MKLYGAILGDILGSIYEGRDKNVKTIDHKSIRLFEDSCHFTDDTVLTIAIADACYFRSTDYATYLAKWGNRYPGCGFGSGFRDWLHGKSDADGGMGNGASMRVSPVAWAYDAQIAIEEARHQAKPTHNHKDGLNGSVAVATAIVVARSTKSKDKILEAVDAISPYALTTFTLDSIRPDYFWTTRARESVPIAIRAFYESENTIDAIQRAISVGGDSDTIASIAGAIAEAYYQDTDEHDSYIRSKLTGEMMEVVDKFNRIYK